MVSSGEGSLQGRQAVLRFLEAETAERGLSLNTQEAYRRDLEAWLAFLQHQGVGWADAAPPVVEQYVQHLLGKRALAPRSVARYLSALRAAYRFWYDEGCVPANPLVRIASPKKAHVLPKILTVREVVHVLEIANQDDTPRGKRLTAMVSLLYATGVRVSELVSLRLAQIAPLAVHREGMLATPENKGFVLRGKGQKERLVLVTQTCIEALRAYLEVRSVFLSVAHPDNAYVFPSRLGFITRQTVFLALKKLAVKAELDPERVSPHVLRHAFATHLLAGGVDLVVLQRLLGHSDLATTQIYTHVASSALREALFKHHPLTQLKE